MTNEQAQPKRRGPKRRLEPQQKLTVEISAAEREILETYAYANGSTIADTVRHAIGLVDVEMTREMFLDCAGIDTDIHLTTSKAAQDDLIAMMNRWMLEEPENSIEVVRQFEDALSSSHIKFQEHLVG